MNESFPSFSPRIRGRWAARKRAGFTILEAMIGMSVIVIGMLAMGSTTVTVHRMTEANKHRQLAATQVQALVESIAAFSDSRLGSETGWANDLIAAYGPGGNPGDQFTVEGLVPWDGEPEVIRVRLITDETLGDDDLGVAIGMPRDLDNDGLVDKIDVGAQARLLPVVVRARWNGPAGAREIARGFYLVGY